MIVYIDRNIDRYKDHNHNEVILVVDDTEEILWMHQEILSEAGFKTLGATNGAEAKQRLQAQTPIQKICLILSDLQMPIMNGIELMHWVSLHFPQIPLIFCTGMPELLSESTQTPTHRALIRKPIKKEELIRTVLQVLGRT